MTATFRSSNESDARAAAVNFLIANRDARKADAPAIAKSARLIVVRTTEGAALYIEADQEAGAVASIVPVAIPAPPGGYSPYFVLYYEDEDFSGLIPRNWSGDERDVL